MRKKRFNLAEIIKNEKLNIFKQLFLAVAIMMGLFIGSGITANAVTIIGGSCGEANSSNIKWEYKKDTKTLTLTGSGTMANFESYPAWQNQEYKNEIEKVVINGNVTNIGKCAFKDLQNLKSFSCNSTKLKAINEQAFKGCKNLPTIYLYGHDKLTNIGEEAFMNCTSLESIQMYDAVTYLGKGAFKGCINATVLRLSSGLKTISEEAFSGCEKLESVNIPANVKTIEKEAFYNCSGLQSVHFDYSSNLETIKAMAFCSCKSLTSISAMPKTVREIGDQAFAYCKLKKLEFGYPSGINKIGDFAFYANDITEVEFYYNLEDIGEGAFYNCQYLRNVKFHESSLLKDLNASVFSNTDLQYIKLPKGLEIVREYALGSRADTLTVEYYSTPGVSFNDNAFYNSYTGIKVKNIIKNSIKLIRFSRSGGDGTMAPIETTDSTYKLPECSFTAPAGKDFDKWDQGEPGKTITITKDMTITAQWKDHDFTETKAKAATCTENGNIAYWYCKTCKKYFADNKGSKEIALANTVINATGHKFGEWKVVKEPTATTAGLKERVCKNDPSHKENETIPPTGKTTEPDPTKGDTPSAPDPTKGETPSTTDPTKSETPSTSDPAKSETPSAGTNNGTTTTENQQSGENNSEKIVVNVYVEGTKVNSTEDKANYGVISSNQESPEVKYVGSTDKKATKIVIPDTVKIEGVTYKITSVSKNAFKKNKYITSVKIGKNVKSIGANAFSGCPKLKTITIGANVESIGNNAFNGCKALTKIDIKTKKLTTKGVAKKAFSGVGKKVKVKVPKKKLSDYSKMFVKKGLSKKVKVTK